MECLLHRPCQRLPLPAPHAAALPDPTPCRHSGIVDPGLGSKAIPRACGGGDGEGSPEAITAAPFFGLIQSDRVGFRSVLIVFVKTACHGRMNIMAGAGACHGR